MKDVREKRFIRTRTTFSQSPMTTVGVTKLGDTGLIFVDAGVKINAAYYCDLLLSQK